MRTRTKVRDSMSSFGVYAGAVALMLELMSCLSSPPDHAPISLYRSDMSVRVVRYGRARCAKDELIAKSCLMLKCSPCTRCIPLGRRRSRPEETYRNEG